MSAKRQFREEQLTAYAMGEVSEKEKERIEKAMSRDPGLRREVAELKKFCGTLYEELAAESKSQDFALRPEQRQKLKDVLPSGGFFSELNLKRILGDWRVYGPLALAGAASVAFYVAKVGALKVGRFGDATDVGFVPAPAEKLVEKTEAPPAGTPMALTQEDGTSPQPLRGKPAPPGMMRLGRVAGSVAGEARPNPARPSKASQPLPEREPSPESYDLIVENGFRSPVEEPLSTFSVDVDVASYANVRRFLKEGQLPPKDAVRLEELINYFDYDYEPPTGDRPFAVHVEVTQAPWRTEHRIVRIGLKGKEIAWGERPASNLVFLVDVSGSMDAPNKLPLVKQAMKLMVENLGEKDRVAIVTYAGAAGVALPPTPANEKQKILDALASLSAGGSTNGGEGIERAYELAEANFVKDGINRVILATDGDFSVGVASPGELRRLVKGNAQKGIFLSVLGFGMGTYKDSTLEKLAAIGNGNYAYIDTESEARKVLVREIGGALVTIAKDVKLQVEFNPAEVKAYRLIGYENRILAHGDFQEDAKDAGDIGAGHTVTALYEVVPQKAPFAVAGSEPLRYQKKSATGVGAGELMTLKLRYKKPDEARSNMLSYVVEDSGKTLGETSADTRFAAGVAAFGMVLRDSEHKGAATFELARRLASEGLGEDRHGYRREFLKLVEQARKLER